MRVDGRQAAPEAGVATLHQLTVKYLLSIDFFTRHNAFRTEVATLLGNLSQL